MMRAASPHSVTAAKAGAPPCRPKKRGASFRWHDGYMEVSI